MAGGERCSPCTPSSRLKDQYHGLGLDAELVSKYGRGRRAAVDTILPVRTLVELAEEKVKPRLEEEHVWGEEPRRALQQLEHKPQ